ncbi:GNAT family N-acetyltransferase [Luteococcus sp. H138]|uniref:GNAT family N-acetyltransferase n=1 Tax=unclassified Luteococcus TaxID=2639923 RepID=UPI00313EC610
MPVGPKDLDDWARLYSAPDLPEVPIERHMAGIQANVEHWLNDGLGYWLVRDSLHDAPVGVGGVRRSKELPDGTWSLYYRFQEASRQQGYAVEVAEAGIRALKVVQPDAELRAMLRPENEAATNVAQKVGLRVTEERSDERGPLQVWSAKVSEL